MSRSDFKYLIICCLISKDSRIQKQISVCNCFLHQIKNRIITLTQLEKRSTGENYYVDLSADNCPPQSADNKQRDWLHRRGRAARISEPSHSHKVCVKTMLAASSTKCSLDTMSFFRPILSKPLSCDVWVCFWSLHVVQTAFHPGAGCGSLAGLPVT